MHACRAIGRLLSSVTMRIQDVHLPKHERPSKRDATAEVGLRLLADRRYEAGQFPGDAFSAVGIRVDVVAILCWPEV